LHLSMQTAEKPAWIKRPQCHAYGFGRLVETDAVGTLSRFKSA
jgi:hypothetical protein